MTWQEIIRQLHALQGNNERSDEAARLNTRLKKILGKGYEELSPKLVATCVGDELFPNAGQWPKGGGF